MVKKKTTYALLIQGLDPAEKMFEELMNKDEVHPEQVFEKIYRGKVQHMKCNEVEAIIQDIVNDFSKEKIINYANGKKGDNYVR